MELNLVQDMVSGGEADTGEKAKGRFLRFLPLGLIALAFLLFYLIGGTSYINLDLIVQSRDHLKELTLHHSLAASLIFALVYLVAVAFSLPIATLLSLIGGFLFGVVLGGVLVAISATLGATLVFLAARSAFGTNLVRKVGTRREQFAKSFEKGAFSYLLALRLAPVFPFFVVNIAPALFKVSLQTFMLSTAIGILPGVFALTYLGAGLDASVALAVEQGRQLQLTDFVTARLTLALLILSFLSILPLLWRNWSAWRSH